MMINQCYLYISHPEDVDGEDCPAGMLPQLLNQEDADFWTGWCKCGEWFMPFAHPDVDDVANAWGDHLQPDQPKRILY